MTSCKDEGEAETLHYYERARERMDIYSETCLPGELLGNRTVTFTSARSSLTLVGQNLLVVGRYFVLIKVRVKRFTQ